MRPKTKQHPDFAEDISQGHLVELMEFTVFRVLIPDPAGDVERVKLAVHISRQSPKTGKLETIIQDWSTAGDIDSAIAKISGDVEPENGRLF